MVLAVVFVGDWPPPLRQVGEAVLAALQAELGTAVPAGTIGIKLVDDAAITRLNKQYNGNAYATDVLTFNYAETDGPTSGELADIVISIEMATRQAATAKTTLATEIGLLVTHGLLHTLGYDHGSPRDQNQMDELQWQILTQAGLTYRNFQWTH
ncbi:MAG TPA: rRNA maturation RNase YbeY [Candidatus Saccharimonadales bacterium]|nr:rRNA maturation RNase YbeY [Candidatus Saccharimonadales bacterium]